MSWLDRYMAVPFKDNGRGFGGADCFGLYLLLLEHEAAARLADPQVSFGKNPNAVKRAIESEIASGRWIRVCEGDGRAARQFARKFDAVIMSAHVALSSGAVVNSELHIGCALGNGFVIHTEDNGGAQYVALDDPGIINRVKAVFRPSILQ